MALLVALQLVGGLHVAAAGASAPAPLFLPTIFATRTVAAACANHTWELCTAVQLVNHSDCDAGWLADGEGYWIAKHTTGCGGPDAVAWSGAAGAYCCPPPPLPLAPGLPTKTDDAAVKAKPPSAHPMVRPTREMMLKREAEFAEKQAKKRKAKQEAETNDDDNINIQKKLHNPNHAMGGRPTREQLLKRYTDHAEVMGNLEAADAVRRASAAASSSKKSTTRSDVPKAEL